MPIQNHSTYIREGGINSTMSKTDKITSEFTQEKRKLLYWISTWNGSEEQVQNINLDLPELSVLLQIMGYRFESFEKLPVGNKQNLSKFELICEASGTKSIFSKPLSLCKCPTNDEMDKIQVWSVTGCGPNASSQNSISSSTNSLIPTISKGKVQIVSYLMTKIFAIINEKDVEEQNGNLTNNFSQNTLLTRYRSLDTLQDNSSSFKENNLKREISWEVGPPTTTSSPVPNITQTLSRISLDSDLNECAKDIEEIKQLVDEKWEKIKNSSKNKIRKRVSDIKPIDSNVRKLVQTPETPRKKITPKRFLTSSGKKTGIATPGSLRKVYGSTSITASGSGPTKTKTGLLKKNITTKSNDVIFKSKIGATSKIKSTVGLNSVSKSNQPGTSGIAKYTKKA